MVIEIIITAGIIIAAGYILYRSIKKSSSGKCTGCSSNSQNCSCCNDCHKKE